MLLSEVYEALESLIKYIPTGCVKGTDKDSIYQFILGAKTTYSKTNKGNKDIDNFCSVNCIEFDRSKYHNFSADKCDLPFGVGEFVIVRYMQMHSYIFTRENVSYWFDILSTNFVITTPLVTLDQYITVTNKAGKDFTFVIRDTYRKDHVCAILGINRNDGLMSQMLLNPSSKKCLYLKSEYDASGIEYHARKEMSSNGGMITLEVVKIIIYNRNHKDDPSHITRNEFMGLVGCNHLQTLKQNLGLRTDSLDTKISSVESSYGVSISDIGLAYSTDMLPIEWVEIYKNSIGKPKTIEPYPVAEAIASVYIEREAVISDEKRYPLNYNVTELIAPMTEAISLFDSLDLPLVNIRDLDGQTLNSLDHVPGVYVVYGSDCEILYIGMSHNLKQRLDASTHHKFSYLALFHKAESVGYITVKAGREYHLEQLLINYYSPRFNGTSGLSYADLVDRTLATAG